MAACAPQRFLAGNRNAVRDAVDLTPSSVLPVENSVLSIPTARDGTAQVSLSGAYTGAEESTFDIEVTDDDVETPLASAPVFDGKGSGTLENIAGTVAQAYTVELSESGLPLLAAQIDFEGVTVKARTAGAAGNSIYFDVDQSGLTFTPQAFSLLRDLSAGAGGSSSPMKGPEFDFDTKTLGADNAIPNDAHRISFGTDPQIYLQYKQYLDGETNYYLVPELKRDVSKGTVVNFVTGSRTVYVGPGSPLESHPGVVTLYDLLDSLKRTSELVDVDGIVANDRTPTGQAAHELQTRTDAYAEKSTGEGSAAAKGFENVTVDDDAGTQLVVATCVAVNPEDHPSAHVGKTMWQLESSILGSLGTIIEGEAFSGADFGVTVPQRLPFAIAEQVGNFTVTDIQYETRDVGIEPPPICPGEGERAGLLGPAAVNQTLTLIWTKRPDGDCACAEMPEANLNTACLGNEGITEGGESVAYQDDTIAKAFALREWYTERVRDNSDVAAAYATQDSFVSAPIRETGYFGGLLSLETIVNRFVDAIKQIDPIAEPYRAAGVTAWDDGVEELQTDVELWDVVALQSIPSDRYTARIGAILAAAGLLDMGGDSAATVSGDGCWQDYGGDYFTVVGSDRGAYAPAFPNHPYYSSRRADNAGSYRSTYEFAFHIRIKEECVSLLEYGDQITMSINAAARPTMYQKGDKCIVGIIAANNLFLAGGQDDSLVQLWYVTGADNGAFPPYNFNPDAPAPYSAVSPSALSFELDAGGIPFAKGDKFHFTIEGGHYRWRKNGGAWSSEEAIPDGGAIFEDGLSIAFTPGASPSFVAGDLYSFRVLQPWAVSNLREPDIEPWKWSGASPSVVIDLGEPTPIDMLSLWHTLPEGAEITIEGGDSPGVYDWSEALTWRPNVTAKPIDEQSPRYLRVSITDADGGSVIWLWAGMALAMSSGANVIPNRRYKFATGDGGGLNSRRRFLGKGRGADVVWPEASLVDADMAELADMLDWVKEQHDEPIVFLSQVTRPEEATLVQVVDDEISEPDLGEGNRNADIARRFEARLSLGAFVQ